MAILLDGRQHRSQRSAKASFQSIFHHTIVDKLFKELAIYNGSSSGRLQYRRQPHRSFAM